MDELKYQIVYSALIAEKDPAAVYEALAEMFQISTEDVRRIFAAQGTVVKSDLDRSAAEQYARIILAAGAICVIEPMPPGCAAGTGPVSSADACRREPVAPHPHAGLPAAGAAPSSDRDMQSASRPAARPDVTETMPPGAPKRTDSAAAGDPEVTAFRADAWKLAGALLLLGAGMPALHTDGGLLWPWQLAAAPPELRWWALVPAFGGAAMVLLRKAGGGLALCGLGAGVLLARNLLFHEAAAAVQLQLLPGEINAGALWVMALLGGAAIVAACRAMETLGERMPLRIIAAAGSVCLAAAAAAGFADGSGMWDSWPLVLLLLLLLLYAGLSLLCAMLPGVPESLLYQNRLLTGMLLCWAPVALLLGHTALDPDGSRSALIPGLLKLVLVYYGGLLAAAAGLHEALLRHLR